MFDNKQILDTCQAAEKILLLFIDFLYCKEKDFIIIHIIADISTFNTELKQIKQKYQQWINVSTRHDKKYTFIIYWF